MNTCIMLICRKVIAKEKRFFCTVLGTNRLIRDWRSPAPPLLIYHCSQLSQGTRRLDTWRLECWELDAWMIAGFHSEISVTCVVGERQEKKNQRENVLNASAGWQRRGLMTAVSIGAGVI